MCSVTTRLLTRQIKLTSLKTAAKTNMFPIKDNFDRMFVALLKKGAEHSAKLVSDLVPQR